MIHIVLADNGISTAERQAAELVRDAILAEWPSAVADSGIQIILVPNARCYAGPVEEVDLLLLLDCPSGVVFSPLGPLPGPGGEPVDLDSIQIYGLAVTIEVKDHTAADVRFTGSQVSVCYHDMRGDRWHDATSQSQKEAIAVAHYIRSQSLKPPFVRHVLWLRNVRPHELPRACASSIGSNLSWSLLLQTALRSQGPRFTEGHWEVDAFDRADSPADVAALFSQVLVPTELDRRRMERLSKQAAEEAVKRWGLETQVGSRLVLLRGQGGSGKTVLLLQLARCLYDHSSARVLILTYNRALVADLRRLVALLKLRQGLPDRSIHIQTVHSYLLEVAQALQLTDGRCSFEGGQDFGPAYERLKAQTLEYMNSGAVQPSDLEGARQRGASALSFDYAFVDEGQDWPQDERDLLLRIYTHRNLVVALGPWQLVRARRPVDWRGSLQRSDLRVVSLDTCLRMKANLARFVSALADELGVPQAAPTPNAEAPGGRVLVLEGDYLANRYLHEELCARNRAAGNEEIDMLFCVPPSLVQGDTSGEPQSLAARTFRDWGLPVWDGVAPTTRLALSLNNRQHRVVQYDSCRGLEGWVVVALALDEFHLYKQAQLAGQASPEEEVPAEDLAALWTLIPATRAMDTIVISLVHGDTALRRALRSAADRCTDFTEWRFADSGSQIIPSPGN